MKCLYILLSFISTSFSVIAQDLPSDTSGDGKKIFEKIEVEAFYPGGIPGWRKYLEKNLKAEVPSDNGAPEGKYTVMVQFIIKKDGSISDVKPITKNGYGTEEEVVRLIKASGNWNPGTQNGRPVNSYHKQPVTFVIDDDAIDIKTKVDYTLFTGTDNELMIDVGKINPENLKVIISKGTITPAGDGKYIARVNKPGERVIVTVYNAKKNDKEIGAVSFEVKAKE